MSDLDNILDLTLDDIADLPSYRPFAAGAHQVLVTMESKEVANKPSIEAKFKLIATMELADENLAEEDKPKEGDEANTLFFLDNEIGLGKFKAFANNFAEFAGTRNLKEIVEAVTEVECVLMNGVKADKNDKTKFYLDVKECTVV